MLEYQLEDIHSLGRLVLSLACGGTGVLSNPKKGLEHVARQYSTEFKAALNYLIVVPEAGTMKTIDEFISRYAYSHFAQILDSAQLANDELESHLSRELENGRLVRLLTKINFIIERPEYDDQRVWSETGERYLLKLFRDYVFHSVDEHGAPAVDMAHVLACMNKLDAGSDEKVMLVSRDEQNCFVASYKEVRRRYLNELTVLTRYQLKRQVDTAFNELCKPSSMALRR
jgi:PAB-dependent poly(A)-specific ribonuclease subunit 3